MLHRLFAVLLPVMYQPGTGLLVVGANKVERVVVVAGTGRNKVVGPRRACHDWLDNTLGSASCGRW